MSAVWKLTLDGYMNLADTGVNLCREEALRCGKLGALDVEPLE